MLVEGLRSLHRIPQHVIDRAEAVAAEFAGRSDYRRGLTILAHGGIGRGCIAEFVEPPAQWRQAVIGVPDLARIYFEHSFDALRLWKVLEQQELLPTRGYTMRNINGFPNLYGYVRSEGMAIVPDMYARGTLQLAPNHVATLRGHLRQRLDHHVVVNPAGRRWVEVQRSATDVFLQRKPRGCHYTWTRSPWRKASCRARSRPSRDPGGSR